MVNRKYLSLFYPSLFDVLYIRTTIRLTVENVSLLPIGFIRLTFEDSTISPMQQVLNDGDLSVAEVYETEFNLLRRPVFKWNRKGEPQEVKPGQKATLTISCLGKVGWYGRLFLPFSHA